MIVDYISKGSGDYSKRLIETISTIYENIEKDAAIFIWSYSPYDPKWTRIKIQCELVNVKKQRISVSEYAEILLQKYPELKDNYTYKKDFYTDLVSYLDHGFMIMQPRNPYLENMRIQRQKGCLYVCGVKFETPILLIFPFLFSSFMLSIANSIDVPACGG